MDLEKPGGGGEEKRGGTRDQEKRGESEEAHEDLGKRREGSPGTGFVMLNRLSRPMFFPLLSLPLCG